VGSRISCVCAADVQASRAEKLEAEVRRLRERLVELEFLRARVDELRAENHLLHDARRELEDQLASRDRDVTSLGQLGRELARYKQLLQQAGEVDDNGNVFISDLCPIRPPNRQLGMYADIHERKIQGYAHTQ